MPTVGLITLGFAWKALVRDVKMVTPWSIMSGVWAKSSHSVVLDYITSLEISSILLAFRRRHWAVFVGPVVVFLSGALTALTHSLTYVRFFASASQKATFRKAPQFQFAVGIHKRLFIPSLQPYWRTVICCPGCGVSAEWPLYPLDQKQPRFRILCEYINSAGKDNYRS